MRSLLSGAIFPMLLLMSSPLLTSCEEKDQSPAVVRPLAVAALSEPTPALRRAAIRRQLSAVCPRPLTDDELEWAAQVVEEARGKGVNWLAGRILQMHRETKICRGDK